MSDSTPATPTPDATPATPAPAPAPVATPAPAASAETTTKTKITLKQGLGYGGVAVLVLAFILVPVILMMNRGSDGRDELKAQIASFQAAEQARVEKEAKEAEEAKAKAEAEKAELAKAELEAAKKAAEDARLAAEKAIKETKEAQETELAKLREEFESKLASMATPAPAPAPATPAPAVNTVNRQFTAEEFLAIYGAPGTPPKVVVTSELEIPKGDILVHSLRDVGSGEFVANQETGRDITVDNVPADIGTEVPIEYFTFAPAALEIYKANNGLKAVITNFETEPGRLLVVFKRRG